jgi:hypothetical protein
MGLLGYNRVIEYNKRGEVRNYPDFIFPLFSHIAFRLKNAYNKAMGEKNELDAVVEMLAQWVIVMKIRNAVNYTDINRPAENLVLHLLNTAYYYYPKNLKQWIIKFF